jgi:lipopolysaccharide biosynthesis regulator YciM
MEIDPAWLLVLPLLFGLGWVASRYDRSQQRREARHVPKDILNGVSAILADDLSAATDALLAAARSAPDAPDLHRAVGNLYRRRGLVDRALEVHETALRNPKLTEEERQQMMLDLGRDFLAAGIFDRAEVVLTELVATGLGQEARRLLLQAAQRTRDWKRATDWALDYQAHAKNEGAALPLPGGQLDQLLAHFYCERAEEALKMKALSEAAEMHAKAVASAAQAQAAGLSGPSRRVRLIEAALKTGQQAVDQSLAGAHRSCRSCGFRSSQFHWQCPGCQNWDCFEESTS